MKIKSGGELGGRGGAGCRILLCVLAAAGLVAMAGQAAAQQAPVPSAAPQPQVAQPQAAPPAAQPQAAPQTAQPQAAPQVAKPHAAPPAAQPQAAPPVVKRKPMPRVTPEDAAARKSDLPKEWAVDEELPPGAIPLEKVEGRKIKTQAQETPPPLNPAGHPIEPPPVATPPIPPPYIEPAVPPPAPAEEVAAPAEEQPKAKIKRPSRYGKKSAVPSPEEAAPSELAAPAVPSEPAAEQAPAVPAAPPSAAEEAAAAGEAPAAAPLPAAPETLMTEKDYRRALKQLDRDQLDAQKEEQKLTDKLAALEIEEDGKELSAKIEKLKAELYDITKKRREMNKRKIELTDGWLRATGKMGGAPAGAGPPPYVPEAAPAPAAEMPPPSAAPEAAAEAATEGEVGTTAKGAKRASKYHKRPYPAAAEEAPAEAAGETVPAPAPSTEVPSVPPPAPAAGGPRISTIPSTTGGAAPAAAPAVAGPVPARISDLPRGWEEPEHLPPGAVKLEDVKGRPVRSTPPPAPLPPPEPMPVLETPAPEVEVEEAPKAFRPPSRWE